jgi:hypothetical protein
LLVARLQGKIVARTGDCAMDRPYGGAWLQQRYVKLMLPQRTFDVGQRAGAPTLHVP